MPGRSWPTQTAPDNTSAGTKPYRYGFNGKESDFEVKNIGGSQQDYGMRIYDPRLGKFLSVDPLAKSYPFLSPFAFAENDVIRCVDLDGLEKNAIIRWYDDGKYTGSTTIEVPDNLKVDPSNQGTLIVNIHSNLKPTSNVQSTQFYNDVSNLVFFSVDGEKKMIGGKIIAESKNSWEKGGIKRVNENPKIAALDYNIPDVTINFEDPSNVTTPTNPEDMGVFTRTLKDNPEFKLQIEGNASKADGVSEATNVQISKDRGKTVKNNILSGGASPSQVETKGSGSSNATVPNNPSDRNATIHTDLPVNHEYD